MNRISPPDKAADAAELVLPLTEIAQLFNAPQIEPLSPSPPEVLGISGVDYLLSLLHLDKKLQRARKLLLQLPPEKPPLRLQHKPRARCIASRNGASNNNAGSCAIPIVTAGRQPAWQ